MPIARPPDKREELLFQWPSPLTGNDAVTVGDGDSCVSMQFGKVLGIFGPGTHHLPLEIPGGVELWFCSTGANQSRKFGGRLPTGVDVFGDYAFRISSPHLVVPTVAGIGSAAAFPQYLDGQVLSALGTAFAATVPSPANMGDAMGRAADRLRGDWHALGISFAGFGDMNTRE